MTNAKRRFAPAKPLLVAAVVLAGLCGGAAIVREAVLRGQPAAPPESSQAGSTAGRQDVSARPPGHLRLPVVGASRDAVRGGGEAPVAVAAEPGTGGTSGGAEGGSEVQNSPPAATLRAGPGLVLTVQVGNGEPERLVGTLLWIRAWIANERAAKTFNENQSRKAQGLPPLEGATVKIGSPNTPWWKFLEFEVVRVDPGAQTKVLTGVNWRDLIPELLRKSTPEQEVGKGSVTVGWEIPPATSRQLPPGRYRIAATFDTRTGAPAGVAKVLLQGAPAELRLKAAKTRRDRAEVMLAEASWALSHGGDVARAQELAREAQKLAPDYMDSHATLGWTYAQQGRYRDAIKEYTVCLEYLEATEPPSRDGPAEVMRQRIEELRRVMERQQQGSQKP